MREPRGNTMRYGRKRTGLSLIEVVVSTMIVGMLLLVAMRSLGAALRASRATSNRGQAALLADSLMAEILATQYSEPDDVSGFGMETGETGGTRETYDDVDDYHAWSASPPQTKDGEVLPNRENWRRHVTVTHVAPDDVTAELPPNDDQGVKLVTVTATYKDEVLATLEAIQTNAWLEMIPELGNNVTTGGKPLLNRPPRAVAAASPLAIGKDKPVSFDATGSSDPDGDSISYWWDFGDGTTDTRPTLTHTYSSEGVYRVTLTVSDGNGGQDSDSFNVSVN